MTLKNKLGITNPTELAREEEKKKAGVIRRLFVTDRQSTQLLDR